MSETKNKPQQKQNWHANVTRCRVTVTMAKQSMQYMESQVPAILYLPHHNLSNYWPPDCQGVQTRGLVAGSLQPQHEISRYSPHLTSYNTQSIHCTIRQMNFYMCMKTYA